MLDMPNKLLLLFKLPVIGFIPPPPAPYPFGLPRFPIPPPPLFIPI